MKWVVRTFRALFNDPAMNEIMCGMVSGMAAMWATHAYFNLVKTASEHTSAFAVPAACLVGAIWGVVFAVLLNLRKRSFSASPTGLSVGDQEQEGTNPHGLNTYPSDEPR